MVAGWAGSCNAAGLERERWLDDRTEADLGNCMYWRTGYLCKGGFVGYGQRMNWVG